jgi:hypothetical protein
MPSHGWQESQGQAREIETQNYEERAAREEARERVTPPPNEPHHPGFVADEYIFAKFRNDLKRYRFQATEHNDSAWCIGMRRYSERQLAMWNQAAEAIEALLNQWNKEDRS